MKEHISHIYLYAHAQARDREQEQEKERWEKDQASPRYLLQFYALLKRRSEAALVVEPRLNRSLSGELSQN